MNHLISFIVLSCIVILFILFCISGIIYIFSKQHIFKKLFHNILGWHISSNDFNIQNNVVYSKCKVCNKEIVKDEPEYWDDTRYWQESNL